MLGKLIRCSVFLYDKDKSQRTPGAKNNICRNESILIASLKEKKCSGKIQSRRSRNTVKQKDARIKCRELFRIFFALLHVKH